VVALNGSTYAFVPGLIASPAADAGMVGVAEVTISTGTTIEARRRMGSLHGSSLANKRDHVMPQPRQASAAYVRAARHREDFGAGGSPILLTAPSPQECAADTVNGDLYFINYSSNIVNVVHVDPTTLAMSLFASYATDATGTVGFSGGSATIVGIAWDPVDGGLIVATPTDYELYSGARAATPNTKIKTIATIVPSENFGYNSVTDQIWSPSYLGETAASPSPNLTLVDIPSGNQYALNILPSTISEPDQGAVDSSDNLAVATEEESYTYYLVPLSQNVLNAPTSGEFTNPNVVTVSPTTSTDERGTDEAIDATSHLLFSAAEFGSGVGVVQLPSSATGTPALVNYVYAELPDDPSTPGSPPELWGDPHAAATFNLAASGPYGLTYDENVNGAPDTVIVLDLRATLAAPASGGSTTLILAPAAGQDVYYITI
jgi:hypothetical protein